MSENTVSTSRKATVSAKELEVATKLVEKHNRQKSAPIRELAAMGWTQGQIARTLSKVFYPDGSKIVRPQHVSNVLREAKSK